MNFKLASVQNLVVGPQHGDVEYCSSMNEHSNDLHVLHIVPM